MSKFSALFVGENLRPTSTSALFATVLYNVAVSRFWALVALYYLFLQIQIEIYG